MSLENMQSNNKDNMHTCISYKYLDSKYFIHPYPKYIKVCVSSAHFFVELKGIDDK